MAAGQQHQQLVDTKLLEKPGKFHGADSDWSDWAFSMRAYLGCLGNHVAYAVEQTESLKQQCHLANMTDEEKLISRQLYYVLALSVKGNALAIVKGVEKNNGIEAWRKLNMRYEPESSSRHYSMMHRLMEVPFSSDLDQLEAAITNWENRVREWEIAATDNLSDSVKRAILLKGAPEAVRTHLVLQELADG